MCVIEGETSATCQKFINNARVYQLQILPLAYRFLLIFKNRNLSKLDIILSPKKAKMPSRYL